MLYERSVRRALVALLRTWAAQVSMRETDGLDVFSNLLPLLDGMKLMQDAICELCQISGETVLEYFERAGFDIEKTVDMILAEWYEKDSE